MGLVQGVERRENFNQRVINDGEMAVFHLLMDDLGGDWRCSFRFCYYDGSDKVIAKYHDCTLSLMDDLWWLSWWKLFCHTTFVSVSSYPCTWSFRTVSTSFCRWCPILHWYFSVFWYNASQTYAWTSRNHHLILLWRDIVPKYRPHDLLILVHAFGLHRRCSPNLFHLQWCLYPSQSWCFEVMWFSFSYITTWQHDVSCLTVPLIRP